MENEIYKTASNCRHYAMCKIDFLGTGICKSGPEKGFVAFYPQGRMDLYSALIKGRVPVTAAAWEIAETCDLCGICDKQCYFITELRPVKVMKALKDHIKNFLENGGVLLETKEDEFLNSLRNITGEKYSTNDPAILVTYSDDPCPLPPPVMPKYVTVPSNEEEISKIVTLCNNNDINYSVRGNGSSVMGFVMSPDLVIDTARMKGIRIDKRNWCVSVAPGVSSFELQQTVKKEGFRVNTAEPSALVCANIMCSGIFSLFSASYGINADNLVTAKFIDKDGKIFSMHEHGTKNLFAYERKDAQLPGICVEATVKMYPVTQDEEGILVPFSDLKGAIEFSKELSLRRIGIAIGILGGEYISTFLSPDIGLAKQIKTVFTDKLDIAYLVLIIGDSYALNSIKTMNVPIIDRDTFRTLYKGLGGFKDSQWSDLIKELSADRNSFEFLTDPSMKPLIESVLDPSEEGLCEYFPNDLKKFFIDIYKKDEYTDLIWLNEFRILSSRMGREKHVFAIIVYLPMEHEIIEAMNADFDKIGNNLGINHDYGFVTPMDQGKRAVFEYDYYIDHTNENEIMKARQAAGAIAQMIEGYSAKNPSVKWIRYTLYQGFTRKEHILYID